MLIDSLTLTLEKSKVLEPFWGKLESGEDATLAVASSARPFLVAARFNYKPQATLVVIAGEEAADTFARHLAAYIGEEKVLRFFERSDFAFEQKPSKPREVSCRMQALHALAAGKECVVVSSARAMLRCLAPPAEKCFVPLMFRVGQNLNQMGNAKVTTFDELKAALEERGYKNTGELEGPGSFCAQGGTLDVYPGNLVYPIRLDFFGDELDEIRRILPSTGQTISTLDQVEVFPIKEYSLTTRGIKRAREVLAKPAKSNAVMRELFEKLEGGLRFDGADALLPLIYGKTASLGDYLKPGVSTVLLEPRSLIDDASHAYEEISARAKGSSIGTKSLYTPAAELSFGSNQRATYVSIMRVGGLVDAELPVKRVEIAGHEEKLYGKLRSLVDAGNTVVFSVPSVKARQDMKLELVDRSLPIVEILDSASANHFEQVELREGFFAALDPSASPQDDILAQDDKTAAQDDKAAAQDDRGAQCHCEELSKKATWQSMDPSASLDPSASPQDDILAQDDKAVVQDDKTAAQDDKGNLLSRLKRGVINIVDVEIPLGMIIPKAKLALVSIADTQGSQKLRKQRRIDVTEITFPYKPGDYVVHAAHGVAFFKELVRQSLEGVSRDYLLLEYAQSDKLYVPVEQLDRVTRYVGAEGASPRLTRLNTADWSRAMKKARSATKQLAFDLVDVYARRAATQGYRYMFDTAEQKAMEEAFPYQETPDQLSAIAEVKADMQSAKPMDRLICGDVGFGKTEVALRAAFKATQDGKQVMVLCPTTILVQQHYTNFKDRFDPFGVRVEVLSRFRTDAQQKATLEAFAKGEVQVLIGTHRLLSRDVNPHDLGLVVIDEEQRFGVGHKEQLKNLRESIDVLTLSATPIPRTMQMSLSGVRDMSIILTPPDDRRPVEVHVGEWDPDVVSGAIRRELARGGQVYYVSNRVRSIEEATKRVTEAAGEARTGIAHGQLSKEQLEHVMEDFSAGELDVLVATTIIESGIDNPHTNTLIIEDSHRLGLSQLYQLKGRVGRSSAQAYAYFMFPANASLTEEAAARLTAVNEHSDLGSGMRIALRDLEIRGAGSLLGAEQSGNMSAVGFDLFAQMLAQAVSATREGDSKALDSLPPALSDITVNVAAHTYLPEEYIRDVDERVLLYRKIASADTVAAVEELLQATLAVRPEMPQATKNFFDKARIKAFAHEKRIKTISVVGGRLTIEPISLSREQQTTLRRAGSRYVDATKKLVVPMRYFKLEENDNPLVAIGGFLTELYDPVDTGVISAK